MPAPGTAPWEIAARKTTQSIRSEQSQTGQVERPQVSDYDASVQVRHSAEARETFSKASQGWGARKDDDQTVKRGRSPPDPERWAQVGHGRWRPQHSRSADREPAQGGEPLNPREFYAGAMSRVFSHGKSMYRDRFGEAPPEVATEMQIQASGLASWDDQWGAHVMRRAPHGFAEFACHREESRAYHRDRKSQVSFEGEDRALYEQGVFHRLAYEEAEFVRSKVETSLRHETMADILNEGEDLITQCNTRMRVAEDQIRQCVRELQSRGHARFSPDELSPYRFHPMQPTVWTARTVRALHQQRP